MEFELEYRDARGRKVSEREWLRSLEHEIVEGAEENIRSQIMAFRCPEHHSAVTKLTASAEGDTLKFEYECCCDKLKAQIDGLLTA